MCYRRRNQWLRLAQALFCLPLIWLVCGVYLLVCVAEGWGGRRGCVYPCAVLGYAMLRYSVGVGVGVMRISGHTILVPCHESQVWDWEMGKALAPCVWLCCSSSSTPAYNGTSPSSSYEAYDALLCCRAMSAMGLAFHALRAVGDRSIGAWC